MKIRFQADADLNEDLVRGLRRREPTIDFKTASDAGLRDLSDEQVLGVAARDARVLVSHDHRTMPRCFADFIPTQTSPGVLIVRQTIPTVVAIEELLLIWSASETDEWTNRICLLPL